MVMIIKFLPPQPRPPLQVALLSLPVMMMVLLNLSLPHLLLLLPRQTHKNQHLPDVILKPQAQ